MMLERIGTFGVSRASESIVWFGSGVDQFEVGASEM